MYLFNYHRPATFEEAFGWLEQTDQKVIIVAGATDVIPLIRDGLMEPDAVVDIKQLPGLRDLKTVDSGPGCGYAPPACLYVGAAVRMNELARSDLVQSSWGLLAEAAASMGNEQVRNRATIGGNICTASPAADSAPALYVLEARVLVRGSGGERSIPISSFFAGPRRNHLKRGELVSGLLIPSPPKGALGAHEKLSRRKAGDLAIVSVAAMAIPKDDTYRWRLALGAVGPTPLRSPESEAILNTSLSDEAIDEAAAAAYGCCCPISDIRSGVSYRQAMVVNLSRRVIRSVISQMPTVTA